MFGRFLPRTANFYDDFDKHADILVAGAQELQSMIGAGGNLIKSAETIGLLEKDADLITRHCVHSLHKIFITPFERDDIYRLITQMDDILDNIEDIAARIVIYQITAIPEALKKMAQILASAIQDVFRLVKGLRKLDDIDTMRHIFVRIHDFEHESDSLLRSALTQLFAEEKDPVTLMKWKEIYELIENAVDCCEDVANTIENIIIEQT